MKSNKTSSIRLNVTPDNYKELILIMCRLNQLNAISDKVHTSIGIQVCNKYLAQTTPLAE